jgi:hypothetical protein
LGLFLEVDWTHFGLFGAKIWEFKEFEANGRVVLLRVLVGFSGFLINIREEN